jgi:RNA polymerase sigma-70 factor (ECF subfamily)
VTTDEHLMLEFRDGSRDAFVALFERYRDPVWRFFRRRVPDAARAEELTQDAFVAVLQGSTRYEPRASFRSYLFGIAYNLWMADCRKLANRRAAGALDEEPAAPASGDPAEAIWVRRALARLGAADREMVMLREYEQLSYQEIADLLRLPINTVRSRLFRARVALKDALAPRVGNVVRMSHDGR